MRGLPNVVAKNRHKTPFDPIKMFHFWVKMVDDRFLPAFATLLHVRFCGTPYFCSVKRKAAHCQTLQPNVDGIDYRTSQPKVLPSASAQRNASINQHT